MTSAALLRRWRLVLPSLSSLLISLFSRSSCRLCIAPCSSSDNWVLPWWLGAQQSRTTMLLTQWHFHLAAFYDCLVRRMYLCPVALSCTHCNVVNQMLQIRRIEYRSAVALLSLLLQINIDVPMSDIIIGLTLTNCNDASSVLHTCGPATTNDLSTRQVLLHSAAPVNVSNDHNCWLAFIPQTAYAVQCHAVSWTWASWLGIRQTVHYP